MPFRGWMAGPPALALLCWAVMRGDLVILQSVIQGGGSSLDLLAKKKTKSCYPSLGLRAVGRRDEIGLVLEEHNFTTGVEVGVQRGLYSEIILKNWKSCKQYNLVDLWKHQDNYTDLANVNDNKQDTYYQDAVTRLAPYENITEFYRMYSTEAAQKLDRESMDFAYIDARHDYCGALEDIAAYWPLVRPGGIMAGHDFHTSTEVRGQDWSLCMDGRRFTGAVKGAVDEFFLPLGLTVTVTYWEARWFSWMVQKPLC